MNTTAASCPNCGTAFAGSNEDSKQTDVSFTTLLDDSNIIFDPVKDEATAGK